MSSKNKSNNEIGTVWRGFSHSWSYNHRMNRLGDYVKSNGEYECDLKKFNFNKPISIHTAASGTGEDNAQFNSYFTIVSSNNLKLIERNEIVDLEGEESDVISKNISVEIKLGDKRSFSEADYTVLLNGFDIFADDSKAKKPIELEIAVKEVTINNSNNSLNFKLHIDFKAACNSAECLFTKKVNYKLIVYYNVVYSKIDNGLNNIRKQIKRRVVWAKEKLFSVSENDNYSKMELINEEIQGKGDEKYKMAFLGIKGFRFKMSGEFHYLKWNQFVVPKNYDPKTGVFDCNVGLHYQTWEEGMKHYEFAGVDFSYSRAGNAELELEIVLIQFKSDSYSKISNSSRSGVIHWDGGNKSAKGCEAINCSVIE